jgi:hypothetical protein
MRIATHPAFPVDAAEAARAVALRVERAGLELTRTALTRKAAEAARRIALCIRLARPDGAAVAGARSAATRGRSERRALARASARQQENPSDSHTERQRTIRKLCNFHGVSKLQLGAAPVIPVRARYSARRQLTPVALSIVDLLNPAWSLRRFTP